MKPRLPCARLLNEPANKLGFGVVAIMLEQKLELGGGAEIESAEWIAGERKNKLGRWTFLRRTSISHSVSGMPNLVKCFEYIYAAGRVASSLRPAGVRQYSTSLILTEVPLIQPISSSRSNFLRFMLPRVRHRPFLNVMSCRT